MSPCARRRRAPSPATSGATTNPDIFETAGFLQDEWDLRNNLKLTAGLRYDRQDFEQPAVRNGDSQLAAAGIDTSFLNIDEDNVAPRWVSPGRRSPAWWCAPATACPAPTSS